MAKATSKNWKTVELGKVVKLINGRAYSQKELLSEGTPIIRIQNLKGGNRWYYSDLKLPEDQYCSSGDLLFAWSATFGPFIWHGSRSIYHYHIWKVKPSEEIDKIFAYYLLENITSLVKAASHGISMLHITKEKMEKWKISLPPLEEQKRIAAIARKCDRIRRTRRFTQQISNTYLQSAFLEMFGHPVDNPAGWKVNSLGRHLSFITSGGRGWAEYYASTGARFIRSYDVQMNSISNTDVAFVQPPNNAEAQRTQVKPGDVLLTITGSRIGRVAPVPSSIGEAYISQHVSILRPKSSINPLFLSYFLSSELGGQEQIRKTQYGQTKPGLNFEQIRDFKVPIPPLSLQEKFAQIVQRYERLRAQQREADRQAEHLFQTVLHRAFRGEL